MSTLGNVTMLGFSQKEGSVVLEIRYSLDLIEKLQTCNGEKGREEKQKCAIESGYFFSTTFSMETK
jgi:hypothetical protein